MATLLYLKTSRTGPVTTSGVRDLLISEAGLGSTTALHFYSTTAGGTQITGTSSGVAVDAWISERFAATTTLTGNVSFRHYATASASGLNTTLRFVLSKMLRGGTGEERPIATYDGPAAIALNDSVNAKTWSFAIPAGTVISVEERLLLKVYAIPFGGTMQAGSVQFSYNTTSDVSQVLVTFDTTFTVLPNTLRLYLHRSGTTGIGGFWDANKNLGPGAFTTAVTNTVASGTEVQCTQTAGGSAIEWITSRFSDAFYVDNVDETDALLDKAGLGVSIKANESATAANCGLRSKVFLWRDGVETLVATMSDTTELPTTATRRTHSSITADSFTPFGIKPDDRFVVRLYLIPVGGTMGGSRTSTLTYDSSAATDSGWLDVYGASDVKAEGDPASAATVPDGQSMLGIGN